VVTGDVLEPASLRVALTGIDTAFYLVHSMGYGAGFTEQDRMAARNFGAAARAAGLRRIIYLGGLGDDTEQLSPHLRSRHEVGHILRASGVPVVELRASIVIGSGSLSFEMVRALTERLPIMVMPRWVAVLAQPIGIEDLVAYLTEAITVDLADSPIIEIGGAERVSYRDLMVEYARQRGLKRLMIPVPVLSPWLSSLWLGLVTPLYARVGRRLIDSIRHPTVVRDPAAARVFRVHPQGVSAAIASAIRNEDREFAETRWSDAVSAGGSRPLPFGGVRLGSRLIDTRAIWIDVSPEVAFTPIGDIGGSHGWYAYHTLWWLRGVLDLCVGGVGLRRGQPARRPLRVGDALGFWRVEAFEAPRRLRLLAEMKLPGRAWLEFEVTPEGKGSRVQQTAIFHPAGLAGLVYWYSIYPLHAMVFRGMLDALREGAKRLQAQGHGPCQNTVPGQHLPLGPTQRTAE
jgi:uncharacterized protein YbjT (DUF2867 family)